jgi:hypothetical protein
MPFPSPDEASYGEAQSRNLQKPFIPTRILQNSFFTPHFAMPRGVLQRWAIGSRKVPGAE